MICDRWSFDETARSSGSSRVPRLVSARDAYAGRRTSHACAPTVARRKTVESAKNARADAAALPSSAALSTTTLPSADGEGNAPRTEPYADSSWTALTATPTAAWPDMSACIAEGPNSAASAVTAVCRKLPAAACSAAATSTPAANTPGERERCVEK
jgi:hypothetical protein